MNRNKKISVIIPTYNAQETVARAIESVLNQTYDDYEIIVIDDASSDGTCAVVSAFLNEHKCIKLLKNTGNKGVAYSRNKGIQESGAEWIAFLDADDYWEKDKLALQIKESEKHPDCKLFFTGSQFTDIDGNMSDFILQIPGQVTYNELLYQNVISCSSVLIKKEVLEEFPMEEDNSIHEDYYTWLRWLKKGNYAVGINRPLLIYQVDKSSKSGNKIAAAKMNYRTYRMMGLSLGKIIYYMGHYMCRNLKKYRNILKK